MHFFQCKTSIIGKDLPPLLPAILTSTRTAGDENEWTYHLFPPKCTSRWWFGILFMFCPTWRSRFSQMDWNHTSLFLPIISSYESCESRESKGKGTTPNLKNPFIRPYATCGWWHRRGFSGPLDSHETTGIITWYLTTDLSTVPLLASVPLDSHEWFGGLGGWAPMTWIRGQLAHGDRWNVPNSWNCSPFQMAFFMAYKWGIRSPRIQVLGWSSKVRFDFFPGITGKNALIVVDMQRLGAFIFWKSWGPKTKVGMK